MSGHTPGPWTIHAPAIFNARQIEDRFIAAGKEHVAEVFQYRNHEKVHADGTALANARLIAAAPDLLEAAWLAIAELSNLATNIDRSIYHRPAYKALEKAIAKTKGVEVSA